MHPKSKGGGLHKKHSANAMPGIAASRHNEKGGGPERRDDSSSQTRARNARKFNSISPKMQHVIAKGLNSKIQTND